MQRKKWGLSHNTRKQMVPVHIDYQTETLRRHFRRPLLSDLDFPRIRTWRPDNMLGHIAQIIRFPVTQSRCQTEVYKLQ